MLMKSPLRPAAMLWVTGLFVAGLTLAACGGATQSETGQDAAGSTQTEAQSQAETEAQNDAEVQETAADEAKEEAAETSDSEEAASAEDENLLAPDQTLPEAAEAACHTIDIPTNQLIAAVSASDWSIGPEDAAITVIEYGDFQ